MLDIEAVMSLAASTSLYLLMRTILNLHAAAVIFQSACMQC